MGPLHDSCPVPRPAPRHFPFMGWAGESQSLPRGAAAMLPAAAARAFSRDGPHSKRVARNPSTQQYGGPRPRGGACNTCCAAVRHATPFCPVTEGVLAPAVLKRHNACGLRQRGKSFLPILPRPGPVPSLLVGSRAEGWAALCRATTPRRRCAKDARGPTRRCSVAGHWPFHIEASSSWAWSSPGPMRSAMSAWASQGWRWLFCLSEAACSWPTLLRTCPYPRLSGRPAGSAETEPTMPGKPVCAMRK